MSSHPPSFFLIPTSRIAPAAVPFLGSTLSGLASVPLHDEGKRGKTYFRPTNIANAAKIPPKINPWAKYMLP